MAQTFKRICLEDHTITAGADSLTLKRGHEYLTSPERGGQVRVFSTYWVWVPVTLFAGEREFTSASKPVCQCCGQPKSEARA